MSKTTGQEWAMAVTLCDALSVVIGDRNRLRTELEDAHSVAKALTLTRQKLERERDDTRREVDALTRTVLDLERRESSIREALGAHYDPDAGESPFGQITGVIAKLERERDDALAKLEAQRALSARLQRPNLP